MDSNNAQVVEASKVSKKKLTHNAAVYTAAGKRIKKVTLKSGKTLKILGTKTINGAKFYKISKNKFVKVGNFKKSKESCKNLKRNKDIR